MSGRAASQRRGEAASAPRAASPTRMLVERSLGYMESSAPRLRRPERTIKAFELGNRPSAIERLKGPGPVNRSAKVPTPHLTSATWRVDPPGTPGSWAGSAGAIAVALLRNSEHTCDSARGCWRPHVLNLSVGGYIHSERRKMMKQQYLGSFSPLTQAAQTKGRRSRNKCLAVR